MNDVRCCPKLATTGHNWPQLAKNWLSVLAGALDLIWMMSVAARNWPKLATTGQELTVCISRGIGSYTSDVRCCPKLATTGHNWPQLAKNWLSVLTGALDLIRVMSVVARNWPQLATTGHNWPQLATTGQELTVCISRGIGSYTNDVRCCPKLAIFGQKFIHEYWCLAYKIYDWL